VPLGSRPIGGTTVHDGLRTLAALICMTGCGPGSVAQAVRPDAPTAADALGEASAAECLQVADSARPLVVDWKPDRRGDLEIAMKEGLAVVAYDCKKLELLTDCHAEGSYGFKGFILKQQVIRLQDADEIRLNLPSLGAVIAAKIEGELSRGSSLDLATILVGKRMSTRMNVAKTEIAGRCDGATHFVRGANIGAFVMQTGTNASVSSAVELFGIGTGGNSESSRLERVIDGSVESCKQSQSDAGEPPSNCGALVRLHLVGLSQDATATKVAKAPAVEEDKDECPQGLVQSGGKCTKPAAAKTHVCKKGDQAGCSAQCEAGEARSCARLAAIHKSVPAKASPLYEKACNAGHAGACSNLGLLYSKAKRDGEAAAAFAKACELGGAVGCFNLGTMHMLGRGVAKDAAKGVALFRQACDGGNAFGCVNLGIAYDDGVGVGEDPTRALGLFRRACEGDEPKACNNVGFMYAKGRGTSKDQDKAAKSYDKGCRLGSARSCYYLGKRHADGSGVAKDEARAKSLFDKACAMGEKKACAEK
jgi:TPR repeat protein